MTLKEQFETNKYVVIKNAISLDVCKLVARDFRMARDLAGTIPSDKKFPFHDEMVDNSFSWYSPLIVEALSDSLIKEVVEQVIEEPVYPTYSYARIYYEGAEMKRHIDRSSSEFSVTCCIDIDKTNEKWNLGVETIEGDKIYIDQDPGDIMIYRGNDLFHWRDPYKGKEQINCFMFYVMANGPKKELKYDTRPLLGMHSNSRLLNSEEQFKRFPTQQY